MNKRASQAALVSALLILSTYANSLAAWAATADEIDAITNQIVAKEIEFQRLNSNLRLHQLSTPWTARRWGLFNAAGVTLTAVGAYINGAGRFSYLHTARLKKVGRAPAKYLFANGGWCRITANAIMVGGGLFETAVLATKDWRDSRHGVDLPTMRKYADTTQNDLDALIAKREAMIATAPAENRELYEAEGRVLRDIRHLTVDEFVRYYASTKSERAFFYTSYLVAATSNFIAGMGGIMSNVGALKVKATPRWKTRLGGSGGIADIVAGSLNQTVPLTVRVAAHIAGSRAKKKLCKQLDCTDETKLDQLHKDQEDFHQLALARPQLQVHGTILHDAAFAKQTSIFDDHEKLRGGDVKAKKRRLISQLIFFTGIGAPKITNGIGITAGAYKYTNDASARARVVGGCALAYGAGYSVAMAELLRSQISNEIRAAKAKKAGTSNGQVLKRNMADLDKLGESVKTGTITPEQPHASFQDLVPLR